MKKIITLIVASSVFFGIQSFAGAVDYKYDEVYDCYYVGSKMETSIEQDPMNNDLFDVISEVQADRSFWWFETYELEYTEDNSKARVIKKILGYDGIGKEEPVTEFIDWREAQTLQEEYEANGDTKPYNDGLTENDGDIPFTFKDINNACYIFSDPAWMGFGLDYNIGLMHETWCESIYVPGQDFPDWGKNSTYIYTIFSDDVNYAFIDADITSFDDNGYAIMDYNDKKYVIRLKRGFIPTVFYDGEKIKFDQIPVIENGRTLVPLRAIFEKIGADVEWNGDTKTVIATKGDITVSLTIDSTTATKNGEEITLDVPAKIISGRTLVPVRFVSDCFGVDVGWDGTMQRVSLTSK